MIVHKLVLVLLIWNFDGSFSTEVAEVKQCPNRHAYYAYNEKRRKDGEFRDWSAWCKRIRFSADIPA